MKRFAIGTLTHDDIKRDEYLGNTIVSFLDSIDYPERIDWFIYHNGSIDSPIFDVIETVSHDYIDKVKFSFRCGMVNNGVGYGINQLNTYLKDYQYSLFLEGDWLTLPQNISGKNKNWLVDSLDLMDKENLDQIQLRRYLNDVDDRQFGLGYWTNERNVEKIEDGYVFLKEREYTNNPHIRRNQTYFDLGIFPLQEFFDEEGNPTELKTSTHWGQAEVKAEGLGKQLKSAWLKGGIMVHCDHFNYDDWNHVEQSIKGCDYDDGSLVHCKYGFLFPREEFCTHCRKDKDFRDLEEHNWIFERNLK